MKTYLIIIAATCLGFGKGNYQTQEVRFGGKIYVQYVSKNPSQVVTQGSISKKYLSDFKVILIQRYYATEKLTIEKIKRSFCNNDKSLMVKYQAKVSYTNSDGYFEFRGLQRQANYILIFCDRGIQMSEVTTGNRLATYSIRDKLVKL